jgi:2-amino-4-hydroxy-6-hydroxymethyldihydropteridine diphosphokinase
VQNASTNRVFILLGSNLGDRFENLLVAHSSVEITAGKIIQRSSIYETAAWGKTDQPSFLNQAIAFQTDLDPHKLLIELQRIEERMGRIKKDKWGPRTIDLDILLLTIDLDILLFDDIVVQSEKLTIPHPAMHLRGFTLVPLAEIAADVVHPVLQKSILTLLQECNDTLTVSKVR